MKLRTKVKQRGISVVGLIFVFAIVGVIAVLALKVVPTYAEFMTIKKAIVSAKAAGTTTSSIRASFDKQADIGYVTAITGKDLEFTPNGSDFDVSFAYQKKFPLVGPASLLLEYEGTTAKVQPPKKAEDK